MAIQLFTEKATAATKGIGEAKAKANVGIVADNDNVDGAGTMPVVHANFLWKQSDQDEMEVRFHIFRARRQVLRNKKSGNVNKVHT